MCSNYVAKLEVKTKSGDIKYHNSAPIDTNIHSKLGKVSPMSVTISMCHYFHVRHSFHMLVFPCLLLFPALHFVSKQYFVLTLGGSFVVSTAYIYMYS